MPPGNGGFLKMKRFLTAILAGSLASAMVAAADSNGNTPAYLVQPGDQIQIQVLDQPQLSAIVHVRPDGMISALLLDDVPAAGHTASQIREALTDGYAKFYRNPKVGVFVQTFSNRTVYVTGEVGQPGSVDLAPGMTAMQALIKAGGLLPTSKLDEAVLLRQVDGGNRKVSSLHLDTVLKGETQDTGLEPADVLYVPKTDIRVYVGGEVSKPGLMALDGHLTALAAVMNAGGITETGSSKKALLIRDDGNHKPVVVALKLDEVMKGAIADTPLKPYDIIFIPRTNIAKLDKAVDQFIRKVIPLTLTGGFSYVLGQPGSAVTFFP